jgi:hypothetical protein
VGEELVGSGVVPATVTFIEAVADRLPPSTAARVTVTVALGPVAAMTDTAHVSVLTPQSAGKIVTPGEPAGTTAAGTVAVLLLVTVKCNGPIPVTLNG